MGVDREEIIIGSGEDWVAYKNSNGEILTVKLGKSKKSQSSGLTIPLAIILALASGMAMLWLGI